MRRRSNRVRSHTCRGLDGVRRTWDIFQVRWGAVAAIVLLTNYLFIYLFPFRSQERDLPALREWTRV